MSRVAVDRDLPGAVGRWSRERGEHPALVFPRDWRWSWWSWAQLQRRSRRDVALLGTLPGGEAVAFPYRPTPCHLALDLALQFTGRCPLPLSVGVGDAASRRDRLRSAGAWARIEGEGEEAPTGVPGVTLPVTDPGEREELPFPEPAASSTLRAWVGGEALELDQERLADAATALQQALELGPGRPIALACGPLEELPERLWLAWGLHSGAVLVLPPEPASVGWGLLWARPTAACLPAPWLPRARAFLEREEKPKSLRRRLRRLERVLFWGAAPAGEEEAWSRLGFPLTPFPPLAALGGDREASALE